jgi:ribonuclease HII
MIDQVLAKVAAGVGARDLTPAERARLAALWQHEERLLAGGYRYVAGVDEAGRGPLAGPVVAAAVILPPGLLLAGLDDSKRVAPEMRVRLAVEVRRKALAWAVGLATVEEIARLNIYRATLLAMERAVRKLRPPADCLIVDGVRLSGLDLHQVSLKGADGQSASVAAASIVAKVVRDRLMEAYHRLYPEYGFQRHKGYATPGHLRALARFGPCPIHRTGFGPVRRLVSAPEG